MAGRSVSLGRVWCARFLGAAMGAAFAIGASGQPANPFTEEAVARGIGYTPQSFGPGFGYGLAFADLDGDGDADLVCVGRLSGVVGVYENDGTGHFVNRSLTSGIPSHPNASGVSAADYDRDGDLDLFITVWTHANMLLRNDGGFQFTNVAAAAGVADEGAGSGCGWGDFDNDGWTDVYLANRTGTIRPNGIPQALEPNRLYRNLGNGRFVNVAPVMGVEAGDDWSFQGTFFDIDRDADSDLYLANDKGTKCVWRNRMWRLDNGTFTDVSVASRTDVCMDAMCVCPGDFDGNGYQDIYLTNSPHVPNRLLLNQGDGTFHDATAEMGVECFRLTWGSVFIDYDNDGDLDLYVCSGHGMNLLYENLWPLPCQEVAAAMGVAAGSVASYSVATADIDNDGDLDMAVSSVGHTVRLYINHEGERRSWAKFSVRGVRTDTWGIGARVDVRVGEVWRTREIIAGSAYKSQDDLVAHFGLGDAEVIDEARITWRGGASVSVTGLAVNTTHTFQEPSCAGDYNQSGAVDSMDFFDFLESFFRNDADFNSDGATNSQDFFDFLLAFFHGCE